MYVFKYLEIKTVFTEIKSGTIEFTAKALDRI